MVLGKTADGQQNFNTSDSKFNINKSMAEATERDRNPYDLDGEIEKS